jgi:hypothetical protein
MYYQTKILGFTVTISKPVSGASKAKKRYDLRRENSLCVRCGTKVNEINHKTPGTKNTFVQCVFCRAKAISKNTTKRFPQ